MATLYGDTAHFAVTADDGGVLAVIDLPWTALE
jgi:hypothetical protein